MEYRELERGSRKVEKLTKNKIKNKMEKFIWTEEYSVGIKEIDEQHQHFFEIANKILDLVVGENQVKEEILKALTELGDYGFYHFSTEEKYFDEFGYDLAPLHVDAHNKYRETVGKYFKDINKDEGVDVKKIAEDMATYSSNWLSNHILLMDKQYTKFFKEHGLN